MRPDREAGESLGLLIVVVERGADPSLTSSDVLLVTGHGRHLFRSSVVPQIFSFLPIWSLRVDEERLAERMERGEFKGWRRRCVRVSMTMRWREPWDNVNGGKVGNE